MTFGYSLIAGGRSDKTGGLAFILSRRSIAVSLCGVSPVRFITTSYTASRIKRENIIEALRDDLV